MNGIPTKQADKRTFLSYKPAQTDTRQCMHNKGNPNHDLPNCHQHETTHDKSAQYNHTPPARGLRFETRPAPALRNNVPAQQETRSVDVVIPTPREFRLRARYTHGLATDEANEVNIWLLRRKEEGASVYSPMHRNKHRLIFVMNGIPTRHADKRNYPPYKPTQTNTRQCSHGKGNPT